jgi:hypothetical protein
MKLLTLIFLFSLAMACSPEDATPITPSNPMDIDFTNSIALKEGMFTGIGGHVVSGTVKIYELASKKYIVFEPYASQNGPDLKVYLSKDETASEYIRVGELMATSGKQIYEIPGNPDLTQYPFVHIWCEQFSVEFARAPLD